MGVSDSSMFVTCIEPPPLPDYTKPIIVTKD